MPSCDRCDRYFADLRALRQHKDASPYHHICYACRLDFSTALGLKEHYVQSDAHAYCQRCDTHFGADHAALARHYHAQHHYCAPCGRFFANEHGLHEHRRQSEHHHYCADCRREFQSASNLASHRGSALRSPKTVRCSFCPQAFVSLAAMILHLESGACASGVDRRRVDRVVRELDRGHVITDPARMLTDGDAGVTTTYCATEAAWNAAVRAFERYLCHGGFRTLGALNRHLASPRHESKVYWCPLSTCRVRFVPLSALCQHIESGRCGVARFRAVRAALDGLVGGVARLAL